MILQRPGLLCHCGIGEFQDARRQGHLPEENLQRHTKRRSPREFQDTEGLRTGETLRSQGR